MELLRIIKDNTAIFDGEREGGESESVKKIKGIFFFSDSAFLFLKEKG